MVKQSKTFVVGTYRTTPFGYKPLSPAVFPKNPLYANVQSKVSTYINSVVSPLKPKESSNTSSE